MFMKRILHELILDFPQICYSDAFFNRNSNLGFNYSLKPSRTLCHVMICEKVGRSCCDDTLLLTIIYYQSNVWTHHRVQYLLISLQLFTLLIINQRHQVYVFYYKYQFMLFYKLFPSCAYSFCVLVLKHVACLNL